MLHVFFGFNCEVIILVRSTSIMFVFLTLCLHFLLLENVIHDIRVYAVELQQYLVNGDVVKVKKL